MIWIWGYPYDLGNHHLIYSNENHDSQQSNLGHTTCSDKARDLRFPHWKRLCNRDIIDSLRISGRHSESWSHHLLTFLPNLVGYIMYIEFLIWVGETLSSQIRILFQDLHNISRRYRHVFLSLTIPHLWHFQCVTSEKVGLYMCCLTQWIGFLGKFS